jgi:hypothetical protein
VLGFVAAFSPDARLQTFSRLSAVAPKAIYLLPGALRYAIREKDYMAKYKYLVAAYTSQRRHSGW